MASENSSPRASGIGVSSRVASIDLIRGAVMVLMALDHVRVFAGIPAGGPIPVLFFTRWITHFCAPAFIFLAGTSAFFYERKHGGISRFLVTRGLWLIFLELTFLRFAWTFNLDYSGYEMAGVIWVIGVCMIIMAGLVKLPLPAIATIGLLIIGGHNVVDPYLGSLIPYLGKSGLSGLWKILYLGFWAGPIHTAGATVWVLYSVIPWIGVMAVGYAFGSVLTLEPEERTKVCVRLGLGAVALFILLRGLDAYGDPRPWGAQVKGDGFGPPMPVWLAFLNTNKYPASLIYLLMTLGPTVALIPALENARGKLAQWVTVFGRVPFFYYMVHVPFIHLTALVVSLGHIGSVDPWLFTNHPMDAPDVPDGYMWSLPTLYAVWAIVVVLLYFASRWFADLKARRTDWWLSYL